MKLVLQYIFLMILSFNGVFALEMASGTIKGRVTDHATQQPLPGVNVIIPGTNSGAATNEDGEYIIRNLVPGRYKLQASFIGYQTAMEEEVIVTNVRPAEVDFALYPSAVQVQGVTVTSDYFQKEAGLSNSIANLKYEEIRRSAGGYEDVMRAISVLPGIAQVEPGRNDLVVRGGAPSENLFTIDGIVIPNINHFGSQGATGGPLSYIDLNFVDNVDLSTGGFTAEFGDKLSSVMKLRLREGRKDQLGGKATISATQFGVNAEGPLSEKVNFLFSARRSYLDFIFKAAGFGFVPEYYDMLNKITYNPGHNDSFSFLFIGAFDNVKYFNNTSDQRYKNSKILGTDQTQYVTGINYQHLIQNGFLTLSLNRNYSEFDASQRDTLQNPLFLNNSVEQENDLKADLVYKPSVNSELSAGALIRFIRVKTNLKLPYFMTRFGDVLSITSLNQKESYRKIGGYLQYNNRLSEYFSINGGIRADYFDGIDNPLTVSPRFSFSVYPDEISSVNFSTGSYYQSPSLIWLAGDTRNKELKNIKALHFVLGYERLLSADVQFRIEGFSKIYSDYPVSTLRPYLILSNTGGGYAGSEDGFSSYALEHLISSGSGKVNGIELLLQKKASGIPYYGIASFTYSKSVFKALDGIERAGSYDQTFIFNISGGYIFNDEWETAFKFRYATGRPYTPFNSDGTQNPLLFNSGRLDAIHSLDLRVDKRWNFEKWALITYIDIQNIYGRKNVSTLNWDDRKGTIAESSGI
ncbi:MAG: TonB-dependent receptor, partial [Syntrophothermus sp.]